MADKKVKATKKAKVTKKVEASKKVEATKKVKVTLVRSPIGIGKKHQACVAGLGLRRMHHTVEVMDTPENRGMINKVSYMLKCEGV